MKYASYLLAIIAIASTSFFIECQNGEISTKNAKNEIWEEKEEKFPLGSRHYWLKNGQKDSIMTVHDKNGILSGVLNFRKDKQEGQSVYYYPSGKTKEEQFYKNGKRDGTFTVWYESGQKQMATDFQNDRMNGFFRKWNPDGSLIIESVFVNDSLQEVKQQQKVNNK